MSSESIVKLRLSVWRDFASGVTLSLWDGKPPAQRVISGDSEIQQEVFSWQMREDPFDGVVADADRTCLRELLLERFEPSSSPRNRRVAGLLDFVVEADRVLASGNCEWSTSLDPPQEDEDAPYRLNSLLVLRNQVDWLVASFGGLPGFSVSVR